MRSDHPRAAHRPRAPDAVVATAPAPPEESNSKAPWPAASKGAAEAPFTCAAGANAAAAMAKGAPC